MPASLSPRHKYSNGKRFGALLAAVPPVLIVVSAIEEEVTFQYNCVCGSRQENLIKSFMRIKFTESGKFPGNNVERRPFPFTESVVNTRR